MSSLVSDSYSYQDWEYYYMRSHTSQPTYFRKFLQGESLPSGLSSDQELHLRDVADRCGFDILLKFVDSQVAACLESERITTHTLAMTYIRELYGTFSPVDVVQFYVDMPSFDPLVATEDAHYIRARKFQLILATYNGLQSALLQLIATLPDSIRLKFTTDMRSAVPSSILYANFAQSLKAFRQSSDTTLAARGQKLQLFCPYCEKSGHRRAHCYVRIRDEKTKAAVNSAAKDYSAVKDSSYHTSEFPGSVSQYTPAC